MFKFLNRENEISRLGKACTQENSAFIVLWGRRRVGKTRLLLEWVKKHKGLYWVADESSPNLQREYFASTLEAVLPGFASVQYPDWRTLFKRLAEEARQKKWRGPLVIDEFPYLVLDSPELPSVIQNFIDHDAKQAKLIVAISGSSQRMMHGLVLNANSPLYGRAREILKLSGIPPSYIGTALDLKSPYDMMRAYGIWGGIPRYWELAAPYKENILLSIEELVLDFQGPLQEEPHRLLAEETPSALSLRPILEVIGFGAHKLSEIAARLGQPSTSLARPMERLTELELIERELPFGSSEKTSKRTLYKIKDPFLRFWFEVVATKRSTMLQIPKIARQRWLEQVITLSSIWATAFEDTCRSLIPQLFVNSENILFKPARRFWQAKGPEWDIVAESLDGKILLLGEVKWIKQNSVANLQKIISDLIAKGSPVNPTPYSKIIYAVFIPIKPKEKWHIPENVRVFDTSDIFSPFPE